jgi:hypothetical protein
MTHGTSLASEDFNLLKGNTVIPKTLVSLSLLCGALLCVPPAFAQAGGGASLPSGSSDNASQAATPAADTPKNITSPSTMGGSVNGTSGQPAIPGSTAGDSVLNKGSLPSGGQPSDANANSAIQQRKAKSLQNQ